MTNSQSSSSEPRSSSFECLDPRVQRWVWSAGWTELRDAQERAIPLILGAEKDVIIAASTASGKTEAAYLPILTDLAQHEGGLPLAMYVGPLKALINDQWLRLEGLVESMEIPVTPWHGDITASRKRDFLKSPHGCLLITPESIEALLMRHGSSLAGLFGGLRYIVIDELHSFIGSERGKQLQSQLCRIERVLQRRVCRIGLSATLGDMDGAKAYLRSEDPNGVALIIANEGGQELQVLIRGVLDPATQQAGGVPNEEGNIPDLVAKTAIVADLFRVLRGTNNLVFPNSRSAVEFFADRLRRRCEEARVPNEFWPHHGSLSKEIREETEAALKQREKPATAICTNTLELGIDIGSVKSVAQIGPPPSVASLRQRLGRSGRRKGESAILRGYVIEHQLTSKSSLSDQLREGLIECSAMVQLLARGWYEPVTSDGLHGSTLVQQILSSIAQHGGLQARQLWELLCKNGAFSTVSQEYFLSLLRHLGEKEVIFQDGTGLILLAPTGERICEHYSFYAAFSSEEEFRIVCSGRTLGSLPITRPLVPGGFIIFGGRRWQVMSVSQEELLVEVQPGSGGVLPGFDGSSGAVIHDRVREEMRNILRTNDPVVFLDKTAQKFLHEARDTYQRLNLNDCFIRSSGDQIQLFLWRGDRVQDTLVLMLHSKGLKGLNEGICVTLTNTTEADVRRVLGEMLRSEPMDAKALAASVHGKARQKWDSFLPDDLLDATFASEYIDIAGTMAALASALATAKSQ